MINTKQWFIPKLSYSPSDNGNNG